jgi:hypothetical protein
LSQSEAAINLLEDDHQPEEAEGFVEVEIIDAPAGAFADTQYASELPTSIIGSPSVVIFGCDERVSHDLGRRSIFDVAEARAELGLG